MRATREEVQRAHRILALSALPTLVTVTPRPEDTDDERREMYRLADAEYEQRCVRVTRHLEAGVHWLRESAEHHEGRQL